MFSKKNPAVSSASTSTNNTVTSLWSRSKYTRRFLKYGLVAIGLGIGYHLVHENFVPKEEVEATPPNTILYVKTSQISSSEHQFGKHRAKWQSFFVKMMEKEHKFDRDNKYLETVMPQFNFHDYILSLEKAVNDDNIIGIVLDVDRVGLHGAQAQELRNVLEKFVDQNRMNAKKLCITYSDHYTSHSGYWIASAFPRVYMHPTGVFQMPQTSSRLFYMKDLLSRLGLEMHKFAREDHKHFGNSFIFSGSEDEILTEKALQNQIKDEESLRKEFLDMITTDIARNRRKQIAVNNQIDYTAVEKTISHLLKRALPAADARNLGLVDSLDYQDSLFSKVISEYMKNDKSATTVNGVKVAAPYHITTLENYTQNRILEHKLMLDKLKNTQDQSSSNIKKTPLSDRVNIGVITYQGNIADATCRNLMWQLNHARDRSDLDAVILRITSPGGDSITSDTLRHHVELMKKSGKRVIVSMGSIAASGGYQMALPADKIVAMPSTITGSIGVVGLRPKVSKTVLEENGIRSVKVEAGDERADLFDPLDKQEIEETNYVIDTLYQDFVSKVAVSRKMTPDQAREIAQGKVYTGRQALEKGLVDELGGLREAIDLARLGDVNDKDSFKRPYVLYPINPPAKGVFTQAASFFYFWNMFKNYTSGSVSYQSKTDVEEL